MLREKTRKMYATCWGFNFPYRKEDLPDHHQFGKEMRTSWNKDPEIMEFVFKLEKNPNIKDNYHFQGYFRFNKTISEWQAKVVVGRKGVHVDALDGPEDVSKMIFYVIKSETQAGEIFFSNQEPGMYQSIEYNYTKEEVI